MTEDQFLEQWSRTNPRYNRAMKQEKMLDACFGCMVVCSALFVLVLVAAMVVGIILALRNWW